MNISWGLHEIYELKLMNDHKCNLMVQCLSQVCDVMERRFDQNNSLQQEFHVQLANVERSVKLAAEWMINYAKRSVSYKFFYASKIEQRWQVAKLGLDESLRTLQLEMQAHASTQIVDLSQQLGAQMIATNPASHPVPVAPPLPAAPVTAASLYPQGPTVAPSSVVMPIGIASGK